MSAGNGWLWKALYYVRGPSLRTNLHAFPRAAPNFSCLFVKRIRWCESDSRLWNWVGDQERRKREVRHWWGSRDKKQRLKENWREGKAMGEKRRRNKANSVWNVPKWSLVLCVLMRIPKITSKVGKVKSYCVTGERQHSVWLKDSGSDSQPSWD